jgi:hypothetical protein
LTKPAKRFGNKNFLFVSYLGKYYDEVILTKECLMLTALSLLGAVFIGGGGLIGTLLTVAILGLIVWLITTYIPMPPMFRTVIWIIAAIFLVILLLNTLGVVGGGGAVITN